MHLSNMSLLRTTLERHGRALVLCALGPAPIEEIATASSRTTTPEAG